MNQSLEINSDIVADNTTLPRIRVTWIVYISGLGLFT
jgi:hypothetical protein